MSYVNEEQDTVKVPEPALVRGFILTITSIIAIVFNINVDLGWIDSVLVIYAALAPMIAGLLIRRKVTPEKTAAERVRKALYTEPPRRAA